MTDRPEPRVADPAVAAIAAQAAAGTPGVVRLQPRVLDAARTAATTAARRVGATLTGRDDLAPSASSSADPDAVDVERGDDGTVTVTVRVVVGLDPPVRQVAQDVARQVTGRLREQADVGATVVVQVVDVDTGVQPW